jgi:hypothetical protein
VDRTHSREPSHPSAVTLPRPNKVRWQGAARQRTISWQAVKIIVKGQRHRPEDHDLQLEYQRPGPGRSRGVIDEDVKPVSECVGGVSRIVRDNERGRESVRLTPALFCRHSPWSELDSS